MASPVIKNSVSKALSFPEAMQAVIDGEKVTRVEWDDKKEYGFMLNEKLSIHTKGEDHTWMVSEGDMRAVDWVVV